MSVPYLKYDTQIKIHNHWVNPKKKMKWNDGYINKHIDSNPIIILTNCHHSSLALIDSAISEDNKIGRAHVCTPVTG